MGLAEAKWGVQPKKMIGVGGGSHSRFWAQIKADVLNMDYGNTEFQDASALGAALLGAVAGGHFSGLEDASLPSVKISAQWVKPSPIQKQAIYQSHFEIFSRLYPVLSSSMHALAQKNQY
jgi:sugar (pentulose or hexulose) kinase